MIKDAKNQFSLLKKLKNTESALLCRATTIVFCTTYGSNRPEGEDGWNVAEPGMVEEYVLAVGLEAVVGLVGEGSAVAVRRDAAAWNVEYA